jgi:phosphoglycolate phosphatase-like HAD superfamily hydrolase
LISIENIPFSNIHILLFDWDGTLNNDDLKHLVACQEVIRKFKLKRFGVTLSDLYHHKYVKSNALKGARARKTGWQYIKLRYRKQISPFLRIFIYIYYELALVFTSSQYDFVFKGYASILRDLKNKKYILSVTTNKGSNIVKKQIQVSNLNGLFSTIIGSNDVLRMKPHPEMMFKSVKIINRKFHTNYSMKNVLVVGDSLNDDVGAAHRAGAYSALLHTKFNPQNSNSKDIGKKSRIIPHLMCENLTFLYNYLLQHEKNQ